MSAINSMQTFLMNYGFLIGFVVTIIGLVSFAIPFQIENSVYYSVSITLFGSGLIFYSVGLKF